MKNENLLKIITQIKNPFPKITMKFNKAKVAHSLSVCH